MPYVLIQHNVPDFNRLMKVFLDDGGRRQLLGSKGGMLLKNVDDPTEFIVFLEWDEVEKAKKFLASLELREAMFSQSPDVKWAGDVTMPKFSVLEKVVDVEA